MSDQDEVLAKEPCPACGSKDNLVRYRDGHAYCFTPGCNRREPPDEHHHPEHRRSKPRMAAPGSALSPERNDAWDGLKSRRLDSKTLRRFGYFRANFKPKGGKQRRAVQVAPYYDQQGNLAYQKLRFSDKTFTVLKVRADAPRLTDCKLYGQQAFGERYDKRVVVHVGEHDAHSSAQVMSFRLPCVSTVSGDAGAVANLKANYRWLDRFQEIILWFDDDEPGQSVVDEAANLFEVGKVKIAKAPGFKDASAALQANKPGDVEAAIWAAVSWRPTGIVNAKEGAESFVKGRMIVPSWPYPFKPMQERILGMRRGEVTYHVGGTGVSKTTLLYHYAVHLAKWAGSGDADRDESYPVKIGWLGFEDTLKSVKVGLLSSHAGRRLHLNPMSEEETGKLYDDLFGAGQFELYDPENAEYGMQPAFGYVRYMAKALDCGLIVIDPLSFLIAGMPTRDRTAAEDKVAAELAALAKSLKVHIHVSHHLRKPNGEPFEEGAEISMSDIRGAGALSFFASNILAYERDQQGDRPDLLKIRVLKVRWTGLTGEALVVKYDPDTGRYGETGDEWPKKKKTGSTGGFGPAKPQDEDHFGKDY